MKPCPVCQSATQSLKDPQLHILYHVCEMCQYIFKDPIHHVDEVREKKEYDRHQNSFESTGYVARFRQLIDESIMPYNAQGNALDFGSGPGPVLYELLQQSGFNAYHYDPYYAPDLSYQSRTYDVITMTEVIEHLRNPRAVLNSLKSLLNPTGILVLTTEFRPGALDDFLAWWYRRDITHIGFFNASSLTTLLSNIGFKVVSMDDKNTIIAKPVRL